jgi:uncharacterized OB-fold protein
VLPIPQITQDNEAFWTGGRDGRLMITRCARCGRYTHPPSPRCAFCFSGEVAPQPVSGRGRVLSLTINRQRWSAEVEPPYVIAIVALEEDSDVRIFTNIVGCPVQEVSIGMPVEVEFLERGRAFLPIFHRAGA